MKKVILLFFIVMVVGGGFFWLSKKQKPNPDKNGVSKFSELLNQEITIKEGTKPIPKPTPTPIPTIDVVKYGPCKNIPVLMYHHVNSLNGEQATNQGLTVKSDIFRQQMDYLGQKNYQIITPKELYDGLNGGLLPAKPLVITFDDGYIDVYNEAFPILKSHNFKFILFLPTGLIDSGPSYLTWNQVKEMGQTGLLSIEAHTWSHKALTNLTSDKLKSEVSLSKKQIEEFYGGPVEAFAYPYGSDNEKVEEELRNEGFLMAFLTTRGLQCAKLPFDFHRIRIGNAPLSTYGIK